MNWLNRISWWYLLQVGAITLLQLVGSSILYGALGFLVYRLSGALLPSVLLVTFAVVIPTIINLYRQIDRAIQLRSDPDVHEEPVPVAPRAAKIPVTPEGERDNILNYAWDLYETYSEGSQRQKQSNARVRKRIIWLIFLTSSLAVFATLPGIRWMLIQTFLSLDGVITSGQIDREASSLLAVQVSNIASFVLSAGLIILSVTTTALLSYANQFAPMKAWILYRAGADRIRSEIYIYRMRAGKYLKYTRDEPEPDEPPKTPEEIRLELRSKFLENIERINQEIYSLETAPPFLQRTDDNDIKFGFSTPRVLWVRLSNLFYNKEPITSGLIKTRGKSDRLPGRYHIEYDDGFNDIDPETYLQYRVIPQRDWYIEKVYEDYEKVKDWRRVILLIGGASAVLAAIQLEPYIVVTTAAIVGINTHIQLNLIGSTYGNYHITASRLDAEIMRWRNLTGDVRAKADEISKFVMNIETILEDERRVWIQQASQAQQETEQALIKGAGRRDMLSFIDEEADSSQDGESSGSQARRSLSRVPLAAFDRSDQLSSEAISPTESADGETVDTATETTQPRTPTAPPNKP